MSPTCMIKPKQTIYQHKPKSKYLKNKQKQKIEESIITSETKQENDEHIYIELDLKCSCSQSKLNKNSSIQFSRRYLQCQSSMPVSILRLYIQQILPHSSMTQISFYDSNDRLLKDSDLLSSLKTQTTSSLHIPIRFTLLNRITSFTHCLCSSSSASASSSPLIEEKTSSIPTIIKNEKINKILSTCSLIQPTSFISPSLSLSPFESSSLSLSNNSISIVNLLTPPLSNSSFYIENLVDSNNINNQSIIDEITSQFGEICPPLSRKKSKNRLLKKDFSTNLPLDLTIKKRPLSSSSSSFDLFSSQTKWIKT